jgi:hypothetical protein
MERIVPPVVGSSTYGHTLVVSSVAYEVWAGNGSHGRDETRSFPIILQACLQVANLLIDDVTLGDDTHSVWVSSTNASTNCDHLVRYISCAVSDDSAAAVEVADDHVRVL